MAALDRRLPSRPNTTPPPFPLPRPLWQGKLSQAPVRHCRDCGGKFSVRPGVRPSGGGVICPFCLSEHWESVAG